LHAALAKNAKSIASLNAALVKNVKSIKKRGFKPTTRGRPGKSRHLTNGKKHTGGDFKVLKRPLKRKARDFDTGNPGASEKEHFTTGIPGAPVPFVEPESTDCRNVAMGRCGTVSRGGLGTSQKRMKKAKKACPRSKES